MRALSPPHHPHTHTHTHAHTRHSSEDSLFTPPDGGWIRALMNAILQPNPSEAAGQQRPQHARPRFTTRTDTNNKTGRKARKHHKFAILGSERAASHVLSIVFKQPANHTHTGDIFLHQNVTSVSRSQDGNEGIECNRGTRLKCDVLPF